MIVKGQKINDRYQIIRMIGEGGMANVYLAYDTILDRNVAVKVLRGDLASDEKFVRRFQREAIAASSLNHPNIVEMYDVGEDDGKYFIVMEYVDGKTLKSLIKKRGALTLPEVIDIMLQLTSGLACAHDSYIIHRDIKPQNVMILDDGRVKITDFGIAMALNSNELTQTNSVMGSVHYLPPEQASGSGSTIKSDIYSLGILMYELLTGKLPFKGDNAVEIAIKQMKDQIPSVCKINPEIPQSIENIILKACAKNPKNRYDNVMEMHEDLKTALSEKRRNEDKVIYKYSEQDLDETKVLPSLTRTKLNRQEEVDAEIEEMDHEKKINIALIVTIALTMIFVSAIGAVVFFYPSFKKVPEAVIPDVSKMTVVDAEKSLKAQGFEVAEEVKEVFDNNIEKGKVVATEPAIGRTLKQGSVITIVISKGENGITLENYVGKNYLEIKAILEREGIYVLINKKAVEDKTTAKENIILEQSPKEGTFVTKGDTVTLIIPDIITEYPDFKKEGYTISAIQKFCDDYGVILNIVYVETDEYKAGEIMSQDKPAGYEVRSGVTLTIEVAKEKVVVTDPDDGPDAGDL